MSARTVTACRVCGGGEFDDVIDLGVQPLANAFLTADEVASKQEARFALHAVRCVRCQLVTLTTVVDPAVMFSRYVYATGMSSTMREHFAAYARTVHERCAPVGSLVVEIGSNDGTLLSAMPAGVRRLGVEPAANIAAMARAKGVDTEVAFFGGAVGKGVADKHGRAAAVIANNVLAHIDDVADVFAGVDAVLDAEGVFVVEAPSLRTLFESRLFDTIYHEHLSYLSAQALQHLAQRHGFRVFAVDVQPVHGGSLRVWMDRSVRAVDDSVAAEVGRETAAGLHTSTAWATFRRDVRAVLDELRAVLEAERDQGRAVWGYAAPAKGNTLLNAAGIGPGLLAQIVDKSPLKQGLFTPGTHIPVVGPDAIGARAPDALCVLAWNLADEVKAEQSAFRARGGRFLVPLPRLVWS